MNFDPNMHDWTTNTVGEIPYIESNFEILVFPKFPKFILSQDFKVGFRKSDLAHLYKT